ncbi:MOSC domain-containing protein [Lentibacter algarum]|uniref:MOSC domain-containing protein n=1 Tax=Lentibacter algarum TaxID=576131 RepID=UPI001C0720C5|nr:MOSC N-terminal beta barrel domain-containing protein [Lentibacter algarum]MBU2981952.1 MOSC domain-containing protein [Lentibacter algarum]
MNAQVTQLWRYPVKSHGREALESVVLTAGQTLPWDRTWAVAHDSSDADGSEWVRCQNFSIGTKAPRLAAINAQLDEVTGLVTLTHPDLETLTFDPDSEGDKLVAWAGPLVPENRAQSVRVIRGQQRGFTDTPFASVSLMSEASHRDVEAKLGHALEDQRWRGNIWFDGLPAWDEFNWIGKTVRIGEAELTVKEPVVRCMHTTASPVTGARDVDTLKTLKANWGHQNFGIYAEVTRTAEIKRGDTIEVL